MKKKVIAIVTLLNSKLALAIEGSREEDIAIAEAQLKAKQASVQYQGLYLLDCSILSALSNITSISSVISS